MYIVAWLIYANFIQSYAANKYNCHILHKFKLCRKNCPLIAFITIRSPGKPAA